MCAKVIDDEEEEDLFEDLEEDDLEEEDVAEEIEEESSLEKGFNFGPILIGLGLIAIIGVATLKLVLGPGELPIVGTYPKKIYTGGEGEYFSYHFFMGLISGLVVLIIGLVATMKGKSKSTPLILEEESEIFEDDNIFEDEEEFKDEEVEEEEEGICPTCGAIIQVSCTECPECGEELAPPEEDIEEEIEEEEALSLTIECPICGAELPEDAKECTECGEPIEVSEDEEEEEDDLFADLEDL